MILWVDIESLGEEVYRGVVVFCGEGLVALVLERVHVRHDGFWAKGVWSWSKRARGQRFCMHYLENVPERLRKGSQSRNVTDDLLRMEVSFHKG